jgi:proteasome lid subunit RPN8/RPN11
LGLTTRDLKEMFAHAEQGYPDEVCGVVIGKRGDPAHNAVRRCANLADEYHGMDPARYPRTARTAYVMDPKDLLRIQSEADAGGLEILAIYHSHTEHEAYFSQTDRDLALLDGEPLWPDTRYVVISVKMGKAIYCKMFIWNALTKDFIEEALTADLSGELSR